MRQVPQILIQQNKAKTEIMDRVAIAIATDSNRLQRSQSALKIGTKNQAHTTGQELYAHRNESIELQNARREIRELTTRCQRLEKVNDELHEIIEGQATEWEVQEQRIRKLADRNEEYRGSLLNAVRRRTGQNRFEMETAPQIPKCPPNVDPYGPKNPWNQPRPRGPNSPWKAPDLRQQPPGPPIDSIAPHQHSNRMPQGQQQPKAAPPQPRLAEDHLPEAARRALIDGRAQIQAALNQSRVDRERKQAEQNAAAQERSTDKKRKATTIYFTAPGRMGYSAIKKIFKNVTANMPDKVPDTILFNMDWFKGKGVEVLEVVLDAEYVALASATLSSLRFRYAREARPFDNFHVDHLGDPSWPSIESSLDRLRKLSTDPKSIPALREHYSDLVRRTEVFKRTSTERENRRRAQQSLAHTSK